jgi:hypothetical protein
MIGELVIASNTPYWRAIAIVLVAASGMLLYLWYAGQNTTFQEVLNGTN